MTKIIGIDLGTTNSCVSVLEFDKAAVIPNREGARTTPSVVSYTKSGERLVGQVAKRQAASHPRTTIHAVKRLMGVSYREFLSRKENLLYDVVPVPDSDAAGVKIGERVYTPQEISAAILREIADVSADYLGETVTKAVITVPAYFNDAQRQATRDAGRIAGLEVLRVINEPTAAALAYGIRSTDAEEKNIAVYDFGGGTFDISILNVGDGVFEVLSTTGDMHLGGEDFDQRLTDMLIQSFQSENGIDLRNDAAAMQRIKEASEIAKQELSVAMVTEVNLPFICMGAGGPLHLNRSVTREEIESLTIDLVQRSIPACKRALADAKLKLSDINEVILVGGMTRMPLIRDTVTQFFGKQPLTNVNPDEVVALGAALQGGVLNGEVREVFLMDVTPLSLGIETMGGVFQVLIPRNTTVPCESSEIFTTTQDFQNMVRVHVLQGERELAADNRSIAVFELHGIPAVLRGVPQIEVSFRIDANGIVSVSAKELVSGISQNIKVQPSGALSEEQIQSMILTAEKERQDDAEKKAKIDAANRVRGMMYTVERTIRELGHAISEETKKNALEALEAAEMSMENLDYLTVEELETYRHTIELHVQVLGNEAYAALMQQ